MIRRTRRGARAVCAREGSVQVSPAGGGGVCAVRRQADVVDARAYGDILHAQRHVMSAINRSRRKDDEDHSLRVCCKRALF